MKYDYLIAGSGLYGAVFAYEMKKRGKKCLVIDKRNHIGGNIYCEKIDDINVHKYGAHIFHTSNKKVWEYINQFAEFNNYINSPIARYKDELYNLPFNMNTFSKMWNIRTPQEAKEIIDYYRTRFQIEFCYRDGKQFTGLTDCQSRDLNKLHFHFNASLTSVNLAKVKAIEKGTVLSMASVKVLCHNIFLMQRFISVLGIRPNEEINRRLWEEGSRFAAIAA